MNPVNRAHARLTIANCALFGGFVATTTLAGLPGCSY